MKLEGKIDIYLSEEGLKIRVHDKNAGVCICNVTLDPHQTLQALGRLAHTSCEVEVFNTGFIGKTQEHEKFSFVLPEGSDYKTRKELAKKKALELLEGTGWIPDNYYASQDSFFTDSQGLSCARTFIRRWV